jgi:hypothetical protein
MVASGAQRVVGGRADAVGGHNWQTEAALEQDITGESQGIASQLLSERSNLDLHLLVGNLSI